jgi:hypothetical protein
MIQRVVLLVLGSLGVTGCSEREHAQPVTQERWSNEAEVLFQHAEVLRYTLEQQLLEQQQLQALEPPEPSTPDTLTAEQQ